MVATHYQPMLKNQLDSIQSNTQEIFNSFFREALTSRTQAEKDALLYYFSGNKKRKAFERILGVYHAYHEALNGGQSLTLYEIGEKESISAHQVRRMLNHRDYAPLNGRKKIKKLTGEQRRKVSLAIHSKTPLTYKDRARFLGVRPATLRYWAQKEGIKKPPRYIAYSGHNKDHILHSHVLDYLEALAVGFNPQEAMEWAGLVCQESVPLILELGEKAISEAIEFLNEIGIESPWDLEGITSTLKDQQV